MNVAKKSIATTNIAIIGAGIGGLTAALAFAQRKFNVDVFEQAPQLAKVGAGLQITPNGARVLNALGVVPNGIDAKAVVPTDGLSGKPITRFDLSRKKPAYRFVHRAALIDQLASACQDAGVAIHLGKRCDTPPDGFDLVVGADGINSKLRHIINTPEAPVFTGQTAWRAIVKMDAEPEAKIWMMPGKHVVTYPLPGGFLNIVAVQERPIWTAEGWSYQDDPENLRHAFSNTCYELTAILERVETTHLWGLFKHDVAPLWHRDNKVLLGDAAHPTLPFLAQGANLAIEDAYSLANCVENHGTRSGLRNYAQLRTPRVTRAIAAANANAKNYHLRGISRSLSFMGLQALGFVAPNAFINRLNWLYEHDVTA